MQTAATVVKMWLYEYVHITLHLKKLPGVRIACIERDIDMALLSVCLSVFPFNAGIVSKRLFDSSIHIIIIG